MTWHVHDTHFTAYAQARGHLFSRSIDNEQTEAFWIINTQRLMQLEMREERRKQWPQNDEKLHCVLL